MLAIVLVPRPGGAQAERALFLARVGADTVAVERLARDGRTASATIRYREPRLVVEQALTVAADATVERIATVIRRGAGADSVVQRATLDFTGDSVRVHRDAVAGTPAPADLTIAVARGAVPYLNLSGLSIELILQRARALGGDSARVPLLITGATKAYAATVVRVAGTDSLLVRIASTTLRVRSDTAGRLLGASVPDQRLVIERLPADAAAAAWTGEDVVSHAPPAGAPYDAVDVAIAARAGALAGTLTRPRVARGVRVPAVILLTGSGPQDRDEATPALPGWRPFRQIADTLSRRGIAVLRLDDRGVGGSAAPTAGATMHEEAADLRDVLAWLRARPEIDPARVGLVGHSSGAAVAAMVAAGDPRVHALVLMAAPARPGRALSEYQIRAVFAEDTTLPLVQRDSLLHVALRQADSVFATGGWMQQFGTYDPLPDVRRVRAPVLVLQGETDRQVPAADAGRLAATLRAAGNRAVALHLFPAMNHLLVNDPSGSTLRYATLPSFAVRADLLAVLGDWLARTLGASTPAK
jgi:dienelactone hydrolase